MAFDFPNAPAQDETFTPAGGPTFTWNGYAWVQSSTPPNALTNIITTTLIASGTYNKPTGLKFLEATIVAAGGGAPTTGSSGGVGTSSASSGGGGGGGAISFYDAASLPASIPYTIGAGGGGGAAGGDTLFHTMSATGGGGGLQIASGSVFAAVNGGSSGGGTGGNVLNASGEYGGGAVRRAHDVPSAAESGSGGASLLAPGNPGHLIAVGGQTLSLVGRFPGGGARGGANSEGNTGGIGSALGGAGVLILKEYF